jgi:YD repeat-containing protein
MANSESVTESCPIDRQRTCGDLQSRSGYDRRATSGNAEEPRMQPREEDAKVRAGFRLNQYRWASCLLSVLSLLSPLAPSASTLNYGYDPLHRLTSVAHPNGTRIEYSYDDAGNMTRKVVTVPERLLDIDGNGATDALSDGLLIVRHLSGMTGAGLTDAAISPDCSRCDTDEIAAYIDQIRAQLDVDANGKVEASTDGQILLRYLFGFTGGSLVSGAIGQGCARCSATQVAEYCDLLMH